MAFIRKINGYYVLVKTKRDGNKVRHITKYIGKKLPNKAELKKMEDQLEEKKYKYISKIEAEQIEKNKTKYNDYIKRLSRSEKNKYYKDFMIRYTYDSSKLSGVDVTLRQTFLILKDGIIPKDIKEIKIVRELENHEKGVVAITKYKGKLDLKFINKLHKILLSGIDEEIAGKTRATLKRNVKIGGTAYVPPKWESLKKELDVFFKWYSSENRKLHPLELAALIHLKLISIQPYVDGNSRLSRLLMNWILWKKGYPMVDIEIDDLEKYYDVLDKYQIGHNEKPFVKYIIKKYLQIM